MSLKVYSLAHQREVTVTTLIDPAKVGLGEVHPVTKLYKVGTGAPSAYKGHNGIDICGPDGCNIYSVTDGVVRVNAYEANGAGNYVSIGTTINGKLICFLYMHMKERSKLKKGQKVKVGDLIGRQGSTGHSTGSHLHFGVAANGKFYDPYGFVVKEKEDKYDMTYDTGKYKISATNLRVRDKYVDGAVVGMVNTGDEFNITGIHMDSDSGAWGQIDKDKWICLETAKGEKYAERTGDADNTSGDTIAKIKEVLAGLEDLLG